MDIQQLLNIKKQNRSTVINEYLKPLRKPTGKKWQHLNWKEKRRVRALWLKMTRGKLTQDEWKEYQDLNFVEEIVTGQALEKENKEKYLKELRQRSERFKKWERRRKIENKRNKERALEEKEQNKRKRNVEMRTFDLRGRETVMK